MSHKDREIQKKAQQRENARRVDDLINLVEKLDFSINLFIFIIPIKHGL